MLRYHSQFACSLKSLHGKSPPYLSGRYCQKLEQAIVNQKHLLQAVTWERLLNIMHIPLLEISCDHWPNTSKYLENKKLSNSQSWKFLTSFFFFGVALKPIWDFCQLLHNLELFFLKWYSLKGTMKKGKHKLTYNFFCYQIL